MARKLFNDLNGVGPNQGQQVTNPYMQALNSLQQNPVGFLARQKLNLPQNFQGGPREMVQHLLNTGQISQQQVQSLQNQINQFMGNRN